MTYRTRQAPSPTGYLHLGTARTVLFTKLFALINNGTWYLRLDDTDRNRLQTYAVQILLKALDEIGLSGDEGISIHKVSQNSKPDDFYKIYQYGDLGPYIQSERLEIYHQHAQALIDKKLCYWSYLSTEEKVELQEIKKSNKRPIDYFKICSAKFQQALYQSVQEGLQDNKNPVLLYRLQRPEKVRCFDELLGETEFDLSLEEDFTALKSDGFPTYHLAHLVDDHLMKTTAVIRSQEWFASFPKHQTMFSDYWGAQNIPKFIHLPFILGTTGNKKMSKRDGNVNMQDYLDQGYLPESIINYLAFVGWNPGDDKEIYLDPSDFA